MLGFLRQVRIPTFLNVLLLTSLLIKVRRRILVVDKVTGPLGHVCIDMVYQVDEASNARIVRDGLPRGKDLLWTREGLPEGRLEWNDDGALVLDGEPILLESVSFGSSTQGVQPSKAFVFGLESFGSLI